MFFEKLSKTTTLGSCVRPTSNCHSDTPAIVYCQQIQRICGCLCHLYFCTSTPGEVSGPPYTAVILPSEKGTPGADIVGSCSCRRASVYPPSPSMTAVQPEYLHLSPVTSPPVQGLPQIAVSCLWEPYKPYGRTVWPECR